MDKAREIRQAALDEIIMAGKMRDVLLTTDQATSILDRLVTKSEDRVINGDYPEKRPTGLMRANSELRGASDDQ